MIVTEDGVEVVLGQRVYNYYDRKAGVIASYPDSHGWFDFQHDDGTRAYLNGQRICTIDYAIRKDWL